MIANRTTQAGLLAGPVHAWAAVLALVMTTPMVHGGPMRPTADVAMTNDIVFVVDIARGAVMRGPLTPGRLPLSGLSPMALADVKKPIAIDARGDRLVVLDADGPAVVDVNLRTNTSKTLVRGAPLREPTGIAIAANGSVAVADAANRAVFLFSDGQEMKVDRRVQTPLQVEFDASDEALYVYDAERGLVRVEYSSVENFEKMRNAERITTTPLTGSARLFSFAPRRGLLYLAEENGLRVAIPAKRSTLTVPQQYYRRRFTSIAIDAQHLAGLDDAGTSIEIIDRPLPVSVNLDPDEEDPNQGMLALLNYLATRRLLAGRGVELESAAEPYERVLARYQILLPVAPDGSGRPLDPQQVRSVFCALNPRRCGESPAAAGDETIIPQLTIDSYLAVSAKSLGGKTIAQHVDEKVLDPSQRANVTAGYIAKLNPNADGSLESELQRRKLVLAVPMSAGPAPGAVIRIDGITDRPAGTLTDRCGPGPAPESSSTYLPETVTTRTLAALPEAIRSAAAAASAPEVELGFGRVVRESLVSLPRDCKVKESAANEVLVTETIKVDALRYRLLAARPTGGRGRPADTRASAAPAAWTVVQGPFVIAYKAVLMSTVAFGLADRAEDPAQLKPGLLDGDAIFRRTSGTANLPSTHWRFDALVPAPDYLAEASPLGELRKAHRSLGLSSHERILASTRSTPMRARPVGTDDVKTTLTMARQNLSKVISYSDDLAAGTEDSYVAVGEADDQVNQDHPGFIHNGRSAWVEATSNGLVRRQPPVAPAAGGTASVHDLAEIEHGSHVAGILGARSSSLTPGLMPNVRLYLVDTAKNLTDAIQDAYEADATMRVFNFSFSIDEAEDELKSRMITHWTDALFVVAAGNKGDNLNDGGAKPLVSWVLEAPNVLGVGAARTDGLDIMGPQPNPGDPANPARGSNFGSRFVQLLAPGEKIHSLGDQQYAVATGTSQAVPQVSAAAAILSARMQGKAGTKIKARLIATSTWRKDFTNKVWGGLLDVDRAVMHLTLNVVRIQSAPDLVRAITLDDDPTNQVTIRGAETYPSDGSHSVVVNTLKVPVRKILRLEHLGSSQFRIVFMEQDRLAIMFGRIEGKIPCVETTQYDRQANLFGPLPAGVQDFCKTGGVPVLQLQDYVAKAAAIPDRVRF